MELFAWCYGVPSNFDKVFRSFVSSVYESVFQRSLCTIVFRVSCLALVVFQVLRVCDSVRAHTAIFPRFLAPNLGTLCSRAAWLRISGLASAAFVPKPPPFRAFRVERRGVGGSITCSPMGSVARAFLAGRPTPPTCCTGCTPLSRRAGPHF